MLVKASIISDLSFAPGKGSSTQVRCSPQWSAHSSPVNTTFPDTNIRSTILGLTIL